MMCPIGRYLAQRKHGKRADNCDYRNSRLHALIRSNARIIVEAFLSRP